MRESRWFFFAALFVQGGRQFAETSYNSAIYVTESKEGSTSRQSCMELQFLDFRRCRLSNFQSSVSNDKTQVVNCFSNEQTLYGLSVTPPFRKTLSTLRRCSTSLSTVFKNMVLLSRYTSVDCRLSEHIITSIVYSNVGGTFSIPQACLQANIVYGIL